MTLFSKETSAASYTTGDSKIGQEPQSQTVPKVFTELCANRYTITWLNWKSVLVNEPHLYSLGGIVFYVI